MSKKTAPPTIAEDVPTLGARTERAAGHVALTRLTLAGILAKHEDDLDCVDDQLFSVLTVLCERLGLADYELSLVNGWDDPCLREPVPDGVDESLGGVQ